MRIGILTHYYESVNYGGNLQAYALCKVLQELGHDARQICIPMAEDCQNLLTSSPNRWVKKLKKCVKATIKGAKYVLLPGYRRSRKGEKARQQRLQKVFSSFNRERIPHSDRVYTDLTVRKTLTQYDMFITGSDQVWNPEWYFPPFFLDFVPSHVHTFENGVCTDCGEADPHYVAPPVSSGDQNDVESNNATGSSRRGSKGESADWTWLLILIIILMVGGIGVLLFFLLKKKK